ncbi:MAG: ankyrin repeat domain-containing protein [Pseudomonadota bacterium]
MNKLPKISIIVSMMTMLKMGTCAEFEKTPAMEKTSGSEACAVISVGCQTKGGIELSLVGGYSCLLNSLENKKEVDLSLKNEDGDSVFMTLVREGCLQLIELIFEYEAAPRNVGTPISNQAKLPADEKIKSLLDGKIKLPVDEKIKRLMNEQDNFGSTPLMLVFRYFSVDRKRNRSAGNIRIARILLEAGADVNKVDNAGETALHYAIEGMASLDDVKMMVEICGLDLSFITKDSTPKYMKELNFKYTGQDNDSDILRYLRMKINGCKEIFEYNQMCSSFFDVQRKWMDENAMTEIQKKDNEKEKKNNKEKRESNQREIARREAENACCVIM